MHHTFRRFHVLDVDSAATLVRLLVDTTNPPPRCSGFRLLTPHGPLVFLNDDGWHTRLEYAVFDEDSRRQIEAVTFSLCDQVAGERILGDLQARRNTVRIESRFPALEHDDTCPHCGANAVEARAL